MVSFRGDDGTKTGADERSEFTTFVKRSMPGLGGSGKRKDPLEVRVLAPAEDRDGVGRGFWHQS